MTPQEKSATFVRGFAAGLQAAAEQLEKAQDAIDGGKKLTPEQLAALVEVKRRELGL